MILDKKRTKIYKNCIDEFLRVSLSHLYISASHIDKNKLLILKTTLNFHLNKRQKEFAIISHPHLFQFSTYVIKTSTHLFILIQELYSTHYFNALVSCGSIILVIHYLVFCFFLKFCLRDEGQVLRVHQSRCVLSQTVLRLLRNSKRKFW